MRDIIIIEDKPEYQKYLEKFIVAEFDDTCVVSPIYCKDIDQWRHYQNINEWGSEV